MTPCPRLADADALPLAADTLAAAFADYPWTRYVIPDDDYAERLRALQYLYLRHAHQHGIVGVTDSADGVIALLPPDAPEPDAETVRQIIALHGDRLDRLGQGESGPPAEESEPGRPGTWRLETLGVHPTRQGSGLGGALVTFGLDTAAQRGARNVVLETSDPRNVQLYQRYGFSTVACSERPDGPSVWSMRAVTS
ncbi:GNAT family N-acetyltransferase [Dietzia sp. ANT_WB102]|uniref:GNAT family N-acetyltransferase n=1 Tax=Dietzia sp. ANT_WB102 TaxID=2597345 RepID=UPI0011EDCA98|nr:GNAT family N-acetyltransferase [Dietzia sp. ANT_WB102]KAA0918610.1 GNAT family N-acetyltransferase [Dietzia sp. ANT_WB102]